MLKSLVRRPAKDGQGSTVKVSSTSVSFCV